MVLKYHELGQHVLAKNVDFAGIQEPHLSPQASKMGEFKEVRDFFHNMGYELMSNFLGEGRGGAALVWNTSRWWLLTAWALGPRILVGILQNTEGQQICVTSAHFSHRPGKRAAQWKKLLNLLVTIPCEHKILLADLNSLVVPSRDSRPDYEDKNRAILDARESETQISQ